VGCAQAIETDRLLHFCHLRIAYRITGNQHDAEDVVQESFLRAFKQLRNYEQRASFSTWLHRIAANCALDLIRARKTHPEPAETRHEFLAGDDAGPERLAYCSEIQRRVTDAMNELSAQERTAFVLRHFEGQSIEEIGGALNLSETAAKHSVFRAVQKLRRALKPALGSVACNT
jgi:RNA polymerase sigma-70 factor (ECF subfamily)